MSLSSAPVSPNSFEEALALLSVLERDFPAEWSTSQETFPLWQDALVFISPEWARVAGSCINLLDQVPLTLMSASKNVASADVSKAYARVGGELESLLKEVSSPDKDTPFFSRKSSLSPTDRLEALLNIKKGLDQGSSERLRHLRQAITLGETTQQLAAIVSDALPLLKEQLNRARESLDPETAPTMSEAQKRIATLKRCERAESALSLVEQRLEQELSPANTLNKGGVEDMVRQEEQLHIRITHLSSMLTRTIAGEQLQNQTRSHGLTLSTIVPNALPQPVSNLPVLAKTVAQPLKGRVLSFLFPQPSSQAPPISSESKQRLKAIQGRYKEYPILAWGEIKKLIDNDENVLPTTQLSSPRVNLLDKMLGEKFLSTVSGSGIELPPLVNELLSRLDNPSEAPLNWARIQDFAFGELKRNAKKQVVWSILSTVDQAIGLKGMEEGLVRFAMDALENSFINSPSKGLTQPIATLLNKYVKPELLDKTLTGANQRAIEGVRLILEDLNPALASITRLHSVFQNMWQEGPVSNSFATMEKLSPTDRYTLGKRILALHDHEKADRWIKAFIGRPFAQADLRSVPTKDTQWLFALPQLLHMRDNTIKKTVFPETLLSVALVMRSDTLLKEIELSCAKLPLTQALPYVEGLNKAPLSIVMDMATNPQKIRALTPAYWCEVFKAEINMISPQSGEDMPPFDITPLMKACHMGNVEWIRALLEAGADPLVKVFHSVDGVNEEISAINFLSRSILKDALQHEPGISTFNESSSEAQGRFLRNMVHAMDQTGLWDIPNAAQPGMKTQLLNSCISTDITSPEENFARQDAIVNYVRSMGRDRFLAWVADEQRFSGAPTIDQFLFYAVKADVVNQAEKESAEALVRTIMADRSNFASVRNKLMSRVDARRIETYCEQMQKLHYQEGTDESGPGETPFQEEKKPTRYAGPF